MTFKKSDQVELLVKLHATNSRTLGLNTLQQNGYCGRHCCDTVGDASAMDTAGCRSMLLYRAWGGAMAAAAAAAQACGGPGRSPAHRSSRHTSNRGAPSVPRDAYADDDEDDTWADRLWHDMQDHKRQAAMAAAAAAAGRTGSSLPFSAGSSRAEAARERERKAAAAAAESARILKEEQAKDADWRAAMMRQVQEVCQCHKIASAHGMMLCAGYALVVCLGRICSMGLCVPCDCAGVGLMHACPGQ
jgi:hypothetical protein